MDTIRDYAAAHPQQVITLITALMASLMKNLLYIRITRSKLSVTMYFWVSLGTLSEHMPQIAWTALFMQLLGMNITNSIVVAVGLFFFNALYSSALFLIRQEWLRALFGTAVALIAEVVWIRHWDFKWLRSAFPDFAAYTLLTAWSFGFIILVFCIVLLVWKRKRRVVDVAEQVHKKLPLGIHQRLMDYLIFSKAKFETFMYLALTEQYFLVGGYLLEAVTLKLVKTAMVPLKLVKLVVSLFMGLVRRPRRA